jgi:hypothetical protein
MGEYLKIVLFCLAAAVGYGIVHDQVTAHLCVEYFTIAHPPLIASDSPFLLAIAWGIVATWWVGLPLGVLLACAARIGTRHRLSLRDVRPAIVALLAFMAVTALVAGTLGGVLTAFGAMRPPRIWMELIPPQKWTAFMAAGWAHLASYASGTVGGLTVVAYVAWRRIFRWRYDTGSSGYSRST